MVIAYSTEPALSAEGVIDCDAKVATAQKSPDALQNEAVSVASCDFVRYSPWTSGMTRYCFHQS
jgi:hypothetical protein